MSEVEVARRQRVDTHKEGEAVLDGRLLSVAEIQRAFRQLLSFPPSESVTAKVPEQERARAACGGGTSSTGTDWRTGPARGSQLAVTHGADLDGAWVGVVAAHAGAGASTVALAIADAAAEVGRAAHLVEAAHPTRSGLVAAANSEFGLDRSGAWRRGSRGRVTIDRRARNDTPASWPAFTAQDEGLVVIDLGLPTPDGITRLATSNCRVVVVCRPTVPGVRLTEQLLNSITGPVVVASVGPGRWPGEVSASLGLRLRELRADNAVVTVPTDRRLEVTGPTNSPLPKPVAAAGRSLLGRIDAAPPGDATASTGTAPQERGTRR